MANVEHYYTGHQDARRQKAAGGVYLDDVLREQAEVQRAKLEGREPDLENPGPIVSTPLVRAGALNPDGDVRGVPVGAVLPVDDVDKDFDVVATEPEEEPVSEEENPFSVPLFTSEGDE
jgi:hypothetical protein